MLDSVCNAALKAYVRDYLRQVLGDRVLELMRTATTMQDLVIPVYTVIVYCLCIVQLLIFIISLSCSTVLVSCSLLHCCCCCLSPFLLS